MANNKHSFGKEFEKAWSEGMKNNDWSSLNDIIVKSVDNFLDGVGDKMNEAMGTNNSSAIPLSKRKEDFSQKTETARRQRQLKAEREQVRRKMEAERQARVSAREAKRLAKRNAANRQLPYPYSDVGSSLSTVNCVVGGVGVGITGATLLMTTLKGALAGAFSTGGIVVPFVFLGVFSFFLFKGLRQGKMANLANRYVQLIGNRQYIDIATLALAANKSEKRVIKDLKKLLDQGYFPQGHFDRDNRTFILTDEVFNRYLELETKGAQNVIDTTARESDEQEFPTLSPEESAELSRMIREGNDQIRRIRQLNNDIPGVEISAKLDRLEGLLKEIFDRIREHPDQMSRIHELMDYYLPTAVKLVDAYREYDRVSEPGREILEAKRDIENTMDTINSALGKLLNKLFKDSVLDVTTDAQVLKTVLIQKGLSNGFEDMKGDNQ